MRWLTLDFGRDSKLGQTLPAAALTLLRATAAAISSRAILSWARARPQADYGRKWKCHCVYVRRCVCWPQSGLDGGGGAGHAQSAARRQDQAESCGGTDRLLTHKLRSVRATKRSWAAFVQRARAATTICIAACRLWNRNRKIEVQNSERLTRCESPPPSDLIDVRASTPVARLLCSHDSDQRRLRRCAKVIALGAAAV